MFTVLTSSIDIPLASGRVVCVDVTRYGEIEAIDGPVTAAEEAEIVAWLRRPYRDDVGAWLDAWEDWS